MGWWLKEAHSVRCTKSGKTFFDGKSKCRRDTGMDGGEDIGGEVYAGGGYLWAWFTISMDNGVQGEEFGGCGWRG